MSFNIAAVSLKDTTTLHLCHPDGTPMYADEAQTKPLEIVLYGKASKQHRTWLTSAMRKAEKEQKSKVKKTADELLIDNAEFFATMTAAIHNFDLEGEKLDSKEMYKKLYSRPDLVWIGEQVTDKLGDAESFLQK